MTNVYEELTKKDLALNSLKEITTAINLNLTEEQLYRIYHFILRGNLNITQMILFIHQERWEKVTSFGIESSVLCLNTLQEKLSAADNPEICELFDVCDIFEFNIPIYHKGKLLACVFAGTKDTKGIDASFIQTLTNILVVAIENKRLAEEEIKKLVLQKELDIAQTVQTLLFPKALPYDEKIKALAFNKPHASVGGDYYDIIWIDEDRALFCIADVSGKGMGAALLMSNFQAALRTLCRQGLELPKIIQELNFLVYDITQGDKFITAFLGIYDFQKKSLHYINAGHQPPLLFPKGISKPILLDKGSTILGVFEPLPFVNFEHIESNEFLLFSYTDGLNETINPKDEMFEEEKIISFLQENLHLDLKTLQQNFFQVLTNFKQEKPFEDDITFMSIKISLP